jgi:hypothetical protein
MSEEKRTQGSGGKSGKSGSGGGRKNKRRYFRRKGKSPASGEAAAAPAPAAESGKAEPAQAQAQAEGRKSSRKRRSSGPAADARTDNNQEARRKRRSRRRSSDRRKRGEPNPEMPQVMDVPETKNYVEPSAVYIHTHIVRPAYRDSAAEYRSEALSHFTGSGTVLNEMSMTRLAGEINQQLDDWFTRQAEPPRRISLEDLDMDDERYTDYTEYTDDEEDEE